MGKNVEIIKNIIEEHENIDSDKREKIEELNIELNVARLHTERLVEEKEKYAIDNIELQKEYDKSINESKQEEEKIISEKEKVEKELQEREQSFTKYDDVRKNLTMELKNIDTEIMRTELNMQEILFKMHTFKYEYDENHIALNGEGLGELDKQYKEQTDILNDLKEAKKIGEDYLKLAKEDLDKMAKELSEKVFGQEEIEQAEPEQVEPEQVETEQAEPEQAEPEQAEPEQSEPEQAEPEQAEPETVEPRPVEPRPVQPRPVQPRPVEPRPVQPRPVQPRTVETKKTEPQPEKAEPTKLYPEKPLQILYVKIGKCQDEKETKYGSLSATYRGEGDIAHDAEPAYESEVTALTDKIEPAEALEQERKDVFNAGGDYFVVNEIERALNNKQLTMDEAKKQLKDYEKLLAGEITAEESQLKLVYDVRGIRKMGLNREERKHLLSTAKKARDSEIANVEAGTFTKMGWKLQDWGNKIKLWNKNRALPKGKEEKEPETEVIDPELELDSKEKAFRARFRESFIGQDLNKGFQEFLPQDKINEAKTKKEVDEILEELNIEDKGEEHE